MTAQREHLDIIILKREAGGLAEVEADWAARQPEDRVAFRAEWHDLMDIFAHLVEAHDQGHLPADDVKDLRVTAAALLNGLPLMERLRLRRPSREALSRIVAARVA